MTIHILKFNTRYFLASGLLLALLFIIAIYVKDQFVRPFIGDVLAVIWVYLVLRSFIHSSIMSIAIFSASFAFLLEIFQYLDVITMLGLEKNQIARIVLGATFDWYDLLAYSLGFATVISAEYCLRGKKLREN